MNNITFYTCMAAILAGAVILCAHDHQRTAEIESSATIDWSTIVHTKPDANGVACYRPTDTIGLACVKVR